MATCTLIQSGGIPCMNEADPASFFDICAEHWSRIISDHNTSTAERHLLAEVACPTCRRAILTGPGIPVACSNPHCWEDAWWNQPAVDESVPARRGTSWVYYIHFGDRVKVGTSSNVKSRLATLPYDELLALEPGSIDIEQGRHTQFAAHRVNGQREWFHDHADIRALVATIRAEHGDPETLLRRTL